MGLLSRNAAADGVVLAGLDISVNSPVAVGGSTGRRVLFVDATGVVQTACSFTASGNGQVLRVAAQASRTSDV
jgi:hypothetical protein